MSASPASTSRYGEALAALAQVEAQIAAIRRMIEENIVQDSLLLEATIAYGDMGKRERALFLKEYDLVRVSPYSPKNKGPAEIAFGRAERARAAPILDSERSK
jgi:hypothetical protein